MSTAKPGRTEGAGLMTGAEAIHLERLGALGRASKRYQRAWRKWLAAMKRGDIPESLTTELQLAFEDLETCTGLARAQRDRALSAASIERRRRRGKSRAPIEAPATLVRR